MGPWSPHFVFSPFYCSQGNLARSIGSGRGQGQAALHWPAPARRGDLAVEDSSISGLKRRNLPVGRLSPRIAVQ